MNNFKKTAIAALALVTLATAATSFAPTQANAGPLLRAAIGGAIVGGLVVGHRARHHAPVYARSCYNRVETRWDAYGNPYNVSVRYCG